MAQERFNDQTLMSTEHDDLLWQIDLDDLINELASMKACEQYQVLFSHSAQSAA